MSSSTANPERAAPRWQRVLGNSVFFYPLLMHFLIVEDQLAAALVGLAAMSLFAAVVALRQPRGWVQALPCGLIALVALTGLGGGHAYALYLPPVVFSLMFAVAFGRTLQSGVTPMIERFMRVHHGDGMTPTLVVYARQLTILWVSLFIAIAVVSIGLALFASLETWSLFANVIDYALVAALFFGQFIYGYLRHGVVDGPSQIVSTALRVARRAVRSASLGR